MSQLATKGMLSTVNTSKGKTLKVVVYKSFEDWQKERKKESSKNIDLDNKKKNEDSKPPEITLLDRQGNPIHIKFIGCLVYKALASNEYIYKHLITKTVDGEPTSRYVYSNIDTFALEYDKELSDAIVSELLSENNITRSNADGYIGEISRQKSSTLEPGDETLNPPFYTYVISKSKAMPGTDLVLNYDGERIEAIRAYKQQEAMKTASEQSKIDSQTKPSEDGR